MCGGGKHLPLNAFEAFLFNFAWQSEITLAKQNAINILGAGGALRLN